MLRNRNEKNKKQSALPSLQITALIQQYVYDIIV